MLVGLIRTIFYIVVFYYLFKLIARLFLPFLLKKGVENMHKRQASQMHDYREKARQNEGKVTVHTQTKKDRDSSGSNLSNAGEYVDYEEVN